MQRGWIGKLRGAILCRIRSVMICTGLAVGALILGSQLLDEGEVVGLTTGGDDRETALWIVDLDGESYLRAASPDVSWLERLRAQPAVVLARAGSERPFRAFPDDGRATVERVNRAMAEKYGLADALWGRISDRSHAIAVRLERLESPDHSLARSPEYAPEDAPEESGRDGRNAN